VPVIVTPERARFVLTGTDFAPVGPEWDAAEDRDRRAYWKNVAVLARDRKRAEFRRRVDVRGQTLRPRATPRADRAAGPVLIPHWSESRAITQLRWEGTATGAVLYWTSSWAAKVRGWRERHGRDVIGLTRESQEMIRRDGRRWWAARVAKGRLGEAGLTRMAGTATTGPAIAQPGDFATSWRRTPGARDAMFAPPERRYDLLRPVPPKRPAWELAWRVGEVLDAAGRGEVRRGDLEVFAAQFRGASLSTLREVLARIGVPGPVGTKAEAVELIRRNLMQRHAESSRPGRRGDGGGGTAQPPKPKPPRPKPAPKPKPEPTPARTPEQIRLDERRAWVAEQKARPEIAAARAKVAKLDEINAEIARLRPRSDELNAMSMGQMTREETEESFELLRRINALYVEKRNFDLTSIDRAALNQADRLDVWERGVQDIPTLVPPKPIRERIAEYAEGDTKVERIRELANQNLDARNRIRSRIDELGQVMDGGQKAQIALVERWQRGEISREELQAQADLIQKMQVDPAGDEMARLHAELAREKKTTQDRVAEILRARDPVQFGWTAPDPGAKSDDGPLAPPMAKTRKAIDDATAWLSRVVEQGGGPAVLEAKIGAGDAYRAHWDEGGRDGYNMQVKVGESPDVVVHEFGHALDARLRLEKSQVVERSREYLMSRVDPSKPKFKLRDRYPGSAYEDWEECFEADFARAFDRGSRSSGDYTARDYGNRATEVLSMGLQELYRDPAGFAARDPEYCKFVLGILDGSLR
jgi:hypothetical protein